MSTAAAACVQSGVIGVAHLRETEPFIVVERTPAGCTVAGAAAARIAQPWPRDASASDVFAEWRWDGAALTVCNDRWGFQPIFYFASKDRIAVSTSVHALLRLGAPVDLDDAALAVFLRLSHFLGADTPFQAVRALPRGAFWMWRPGGGRGIWVKPRPQQAEGLSRKSPIAGSAALSR